MSANTELMWLQRQHPHPLDARIRFEEGPHLYYVDGINNNVSVTTFIHKFFPEFEADKIIGKMRKSSRWENSPYYGMTNQEIKDQWEAKRDKASREGTRLHYDIELFYNNIMPDNNSVEYGYFQKFHKDQILEKGLVPYRTEWVVFDTDYGLAGSIDMIFKVGNGDDNRLVIYDWKRCTQIIKNNRFDTGKPPVEHLPDSNFWHYALQLNMYRFILQKNYGKKVEGLFLVCLHPEQKSYVQVSVPLMDDEIMDLLQVRKLQLGGVA